MTIALVINTNEGAVLATDSATTISANNQVFQIYNNAIKIVNLCKGRPFGVATYGLGNIGPYSITLLAKEYRESLMTGKVWSVSQKSVPTSGAKRQKGALKSLSPSLAIAFDAECYQLSDVAQDFGNFIQNFYTNEFPASGGVFPTLGFILTGYSSNERLPETFVIESDSTGQMVVTPYNILENGGIIAKGQPNAIYSLTLGISSDVLDALITGLNLDDQQASNFMQLVWSTVRPIVLRTMPIQDTIDLAKFLVETGIQFQRFKLDDKTVGGPVEIATMTRYEGFKWVQRKHYFDSSLNPAHIRS